MSITTEGRYTQYCTFCGVVAGKTDDSNLVDVVGDCCQGLPEPWSRGAGGLYGTDARYDDLGDVADGEGPDPDYPDEDDYDDYEGSYNQRWDTGRLEPYEVDELPRLTFTAYNRNRARLGMPAVTR